MFIHNKTFLVVDRCLPQILSDLLIGFQGQGQVNQLLIPICFFHEELKIGLNKKFWLTFRSSHILLRLTTSRRDCEQNFFSNGKLLYLCDVQPSLRHWQEATAGVIQVTTKLSDKDVRRRKRLLHLFFSKPAKGNRNIMSATIWTQRQLCCEASNSTTH